MATCSTNLSQASQEEAPSPPLSSTKTPLLAQGKSEGPAELLRTLVYSIGFSLNRVGTGLNKV